MKKIEAIIRKTKFQEVKETLHESAMVKRGMNHFMSKINEAGNKIYSNSKHSVLPFPGKMLRASF